MNTLRVVLADDHALLRAGIRAVLAGLDDIAVVGEAADGAEALRLVEELGPDVLLTDISMGGLSGLDLVARVGRDFPATRAVVLSMHTAREYVSRALRAGAFGYLVKDQGTDEVERAIRCVARGEIYLSPAISGAVVEEYVRLADAQAAASDPLTPRQREILTLIAQGKPTKAIAHQLWISVKTVETHRAQIMDRLGIHDVAGLVRYAIRAGLVPPEG